jgi:type I restriction enzyme S subunit
MTPEQLKASILKAAFDGKLVEQNGNDEKVEVLLSRVKETQKKAMKEGKIKKNTKFAEVKDDEIHSDLPSSWSCIKLGEISQLVDGEKIKGPEYNYLEVKYLRGKTEPQKMTEGKYATKGKKVILVDGENSGEVFELPEDGYLGSTFKVLYISPEMYVDYVLKFFELKRSELRENKKGAAIPHLDKELLFNYVLPVPPLEEQYRIVAKIEELLPYVDHYAASWEKLEHFNAKFPEDMRKSILQYAIQGKLVEQRPEEGTAEKLYQQIQAEKQKLIKEGKIKKEKPLPVISEIEVPFDIPESWKWVFFSELCSVLTCGYASTPTYVSEDVGMPFISAKNVKPYCFMPDEHKFIGKDLYEKLTSTAKPEKGDILLTRVGAGIGEAAIIDVDMDFAIYVSLTLIKLVNNNLINNRYILHWLNSPLGTSTAQKNILGKGASQGNLNVKNVRDFLVPLPPYEEQVRIANKLDEVLPYCDRLVKK